MKTLYLFATLVALFGLTGIVRADCTLKIKFKGSPNPLTAPGPDGKSAEWVFTGVGEVMPATVETRAKAGLIWGGYKDQKGYLTGEGLERVYITQTDAACSAQRQMKVGFVDLKFKMKNSNWDKMIRVQMYEFDLPSENIAGVQSVSHSITVKPWAKY